MLFWQNAERTEGFSPKPPCSNAGVIKLMKKEKGADNGRT